jgi:hypothetical protein
MCCKSLIMHRTCSFRRSLCREAPSCILQHGSSSSSSSGSSISSVLQSQQQHKHNSRCKATAVCIGTSSHLPIPGQLAQDHAGVAIAHQVLPVASDTSVLGLCSPSVALYLPLYSGRRAVVAGAGPCGKPGGPLCCCVMRPW